MRGLRSRDEIHAAGGESCVLGGARDRCKLRERLEQAAARFAHSRIRLDRKDPVPIFQQESRKCSGARGNVGDRMERFQSALYTHKFEDLQRISRTIADVILHSIGKSRGWRLAHCVLV